MLSGPQALRPADRVRILGAALGRELRFEAQSDAEARAQMSAQMPAEYVDAFFDFYVDGALDESQVQPTVQEVLGREPRSFEQWAAGARRGLPIDGAGGSAMSRRGAPVLTPIEPPKGGAHDARARDRNPRGMAGGSR